MARCGGLYAGLVLGRRSWPRHGPQLSDSIHAYCTKGSACRYRGQLAKTKGPGGAAPGPIQTCLTAGVTPAGPNLETRIDEFGFPFFQWRQPSLSNPVLNPSGIRGCSPSAGLLHQGHRICARGLARRACSRIPELEIISAVENSG
jgi:hypothetical protein